MRLINFACGCILAVLALPLAFAQPSYPTRPVRLVVPYPAGGGSDLLARALSQGLSKNLGQNIVVDNRGGATGMIGTDIAAKSPADGYTILLGSVAEVALNAAVYRKMSYDPERDLAPITLIAVSPLVLAVHPSLPVHSVKEFIALARKRPGEISYGTAGSGSPHHIAGEWMKLLAKIDITHVPYRGGGPQLVDLLGGQVQSGFVALPVAAPYLKAGRLRAIAVTSAKRSPSIPDVPTLEESGLHGLDVSQWWGMLAPANTPRDIIARLATDVTVVAKQPDVRASLDQLGAVPVLDTPTQFDEFIRAEIAKYRKVVKDAGITLE